MSYTSPSNKYDFMNMFHRQHRRRFHGYDYKRIDHGYGSEVLQLPWLSGLGKCMLDDLDSCLPWSDQ